MTSRTVIGTDTAVANPDLGTQTFMGATVVDFSCNSSWDEQGATCTVSLIEDSGQRINKNSVVGQPQYFEIVDSSDNLVFCFYGILKDISRSVGANGERKYSATLQSPSLLLQSVSIITDHYIGAGDALEAVAPNTATSLEFGHINSSVNFANVYNLLNPFGVFENDDYGLSTPKGFGGAQVNDEGMRLDRFVAAIDALINGSNAANPNLGRPILYGADKWGGIVAPYYYTFDIYGFVNSISSFIPFDYRVKSTTLMDFVSELCKEINFIFMVDLRKPSGKGTAGISGPFGVATDNASEGTGTFGGEIFIITQNRNVYGSTKFPLSYQIVNREISDKLGGYSTTSFSPAFSVGFGGNDLPLDFAWDAGDVHPGGPANASSPFGGSAPFENITQDSLERYTQTNLQVSLNEGAVGGKVVVGGFQSRIGFVPYANNIYQYWGDIKRLDNFGSNAAASDTAQRGIPVVTKVLSGLDLRDIILLDVQDLVGNTTVAPLVQTGAGRNPHYANISVIFSGIYSCSMLEVRFAMDDFRSWMFFLERNKPAKLIALETYFSEKASNIKDMMYHPNGELTYAGKAFRAKAFTTIASYNTAAHAASSPQSVIDCSDPVTGSLAAVYRQFLQKLHAKIQAMGNNHYGKSWFVKQPVFTTKVDENDETVIADLVRSWELSDDAYLEPTNFAAYEAPQSPLFVNNGRLKAYVNYDSNFVKSYIIKGRPVTVNVNNDFREYASSKFGQTHDPTTGSYIFHFDVEFEKNYQFLPTTYFTNYDESLFTALVDISTGVITSMPAAVKVEEARMISVVSYMLSNASKIVEAGIGMFPYVLCRTNRVFQPVLVPSEGGNSDTSINNLDAMAQFSCEQSIAARKNTGGDQAFFAKPFPIPVVPRSFGIPQQSNRYVYGPWITNSIKLDYATSVEYDKDDNLVPEKYIIPSQVTIGGITYTLNSGLAGVNTVGQAKANTIDNIDYLFTEQGSITQAGLPTVTSLAVSLVSHGPLVSDISVNVSATDITTNYSMKTFAPKLGRTNKRFIDQLGKLGKRINSIASLVK